jgi:hypothetical protein
MQSIQLSCSQDVLPIIGTTVLSDSCSITIDASVQLLLDCKRAVATLFTAGTPQLLSNAALANTGDRTKREYSKWQSSVLLSSLSVATKLSIKLCNCNQRRQLQNTPRLNDRPDTYTSKCQTPHVPFMCASVCRKCVVCDTFCLKPPPQYTDNASWKQAVISRIHNTINRCQLALLNAV